MLEDFKKYLLTEKRVSNHTLNAYVNDVSSFFNFAEISLEDIKEINHHSVRGWIVELIDHNISNKSVNRKLSSLRTFFRWTLKENRIVDNPMLKIQGPKVEKRIPEFVKQTDLEVDNNNTETIDKETSLMVEIFYQTGIRLSELIGLRKKNIQFDSIKVLGKRNKERMIPISYQLYEEIKVYSALNKEYNETDFLFCTKKGKKLYPKFVYRKINKYLSTVTSLGKKSPHVLRHTFATHMLNNGAGLETLKELLGHTNLSATQIYTHNSFEEINKIYKQAHPRGEHKK